MEIPTVKVTMLGTTGSGKSTFMLGMYATLSAGLRGYFVYAQDQDDHIDLTDAWDRLLDDGLLPPPTTEERSRRYEFVFTQGFDTLLNIDWLDYRGGALTDRKTARDTAELQQRLGQSDSVYLVLDGNAVGRWVRSIVEGEGDNPSLRLERIQRELKVQDMTAQLNRCVGERRKAGLPAPSVVALITKMDTLPVTSGLDRIDAINLAVEHLPELLPVVTSGLTTLVSPVQLGEFGTEHHDTVDTQRVNPTHLHKPFVFTLMQYLWSGIEDNETELENLAAADVAAATELERLRSGVVRSLRNRGRINSLQSEKQRRRSAAESRRSTVNLMNSRVQQLRDELMNLPIYRNGKLAP
ncbi:hypothetical protein [Frankia sp. QA3]|uniref:hypothetical protein n=1 Tax=Frankia sp. QA3 TaxID=710111 RepID=UPI000567BBE7|nr:hypothetical protein [Frankia sp. QA3]